MTKSMIQHCFHPSILSSQTVHCYSQYSAFTLAHLALKLIIKYTGSTLILTLTLARLALKLIIKHTLKLVQKLKCTAYILILHKYDACT